MNKVFYALFLQMIVKRLLYTELFGILYPLRVLLSGREATYLPAPTKELHAALQKLEGTLEGSGGPFMCGEQLTYADASVTAILREVLAFDCFDRAALLATRPKLASYLQALEAKTQPWVDERVAKHQLGIASTIDFMVATNTPFPWSRKSKAK